MRPEEMAPTDTSSPSEQLPGLDFRLWVDLGVPLALMNGTHHFSVSSSCVGVAEIDSEDCSSHAAFARQL